MTISQAFLMVMTMFALFVINWLYTGESVRLLRQHMKESFESYDTLLKFYASEIDRLTCQINKEKIDKKA